MPDLFHGDAIDKALAELTTAAQQLTETAAMVKAVLRDVDTLVLRLTEAVDRLLGTKAP